MQKEVVLLFSTLLISISGLIYQLINGTLSSYLLGDSVYQFSLVIGLFVSSMGIGSWFSRYIVNLEKSFFLLQVSISLIGGFSVFILFFAFAYIQNYEPFLYIVTISIGALIGSEIPIIIRILKNSFELKVNISNIFTLDYIGALVASLLFPLILLPKLGLMQSAFLFGLINLFVAFLSFYTFRLGKKYLFVAITALVALVFGLVKSNSLTSFIENKLYNNNIIYSKQTKYQKIIVTAMGNRTAFYINGAIQFDTIDEFRYHESLIHPIMLNVPHKENILIIGGGDGMALREVLKYKDVKKVTLVDLDSQITTLFKTNKRLSALNHHSFDNPRVTVVNKDAWKFLEHSNKLYNAIIVDLPDPNNISLSNLYSKSFYKLIKSKLTRDGIFVTQATSPLFTRKAFWSIAKTIKSAGFKTYPYHTYVPSFGEWGFVIGSNINLDFNKTIPFKTRYLTTNIMQKSLIFPKDMSSLNVEINKIDSHKLLNYYNHGWDRWYGK